MGKIPDVLSYIAIERKALRDLLCDDSGDEDGNYVLQAMDSILLNIEHMLIRQEGSGADL